MIPDELNHELKRLSDRLNRIEQWLGLGADAESDADESTDPSTDAFAPEPIKDRAVPPVLPTITPVVEQRTSAERIEERDAPAASDFAAKESNADLWASAAPPIPGQLLNAYRRLFKDSNADEPAESQPVVAETARATPFSPHPPATSPPEPDSPRPLETLEQLIGGRIMAWAGALTVVVAVGFFVKLAYDQGWLGRLPPSVRCLASGVFGLMLIGAGELALRRIGRAAAVGLFGAGLGTLYLTAYAAYRYFNLLTQVEAFVLLAMVALLGFALTVRGRLLVIGVLSVLAGYLSPVLLAGHAASPVALPLYLTMLLAISLGLAAARDPFIPLRCVALVAHGVIGLLWTQGEAAEHKLLSMVFLSLWWCMVAAESVRAARRERAAFGNVAATLLGTFWYVSAGCWVLSHLHQGHSRGLGVFVFSIGLISIALVMSLGTGIHALRRRPRRAIGKLSVALWVQSGILLTTANALYFDDFGQTIAWLATAVGCIEIGRRLRARRVDGFGLLVGVLALARLVTVDANLTSLQARVWEWPELIITRWAILALAAVAAVQLAARRIHVGRKGEWRTAPVVLATLGTFGWLCLCTIQAQGVTNTGGWLLAAVVLVACEGVGRRQHYLELGLLVLVATTGRWLIADSLIPRLDPTWNALARTPLLNGQMGMAAAIAVCGGWATRVLRRRATDETSVFVGAAAPAVWQVVFLACSTLVLIALSFEIDRAVVGVAARGGHLAWSVGQFRQLLLTLLWCIGALGVGVFAAAFQGRRAVGAPLLLHFAWCLLVLCTVKFVCVDTLFASVWSDARTTTGANPLPLLNVQMLVGILLAACGLLLGRCMGWRSESDAGSHATGGFVPLGTPNLALWLPVASSLLLLWSLSFEVDRLIGRLAAQGWTWPWPGIQLRAMWLTLLWAAGGLAMALYGRLRPWRTMRDSGALVLFVAAFVWLIYDTLGWRITHGIVLAGVVVNLQFISGVALTALLAWLRRLSRVKGDGADANRHATARVCFGLILTIGLWLGTLEIDRFFAPQADRLAHAALARQTGLSVYWGLYGIGLVALGFSRRIARCRHVGLGLLSVTLAKVLLVDLAGVGYVYRVLSLLAVGLLLVVTSIAYAKLGPRFLAGDSPGA